MSTPPDTPLTLPLTPPSPKPNPSTATAAPADAGTTAATPAATRKHRADHSNRTRTNSPLPSQFSTDIAVQRIERHCSDGPTKTSLSFPPRDAKT